MCLVPSSPNWFDSHQYIALWLEGIALLAIFVWDRIDASQQHKQIVAQIRASETAATAANKSAEALINSERAWVIAELVPVCIKFGKSWHRPVDPATNAGNGWAKMSEEEVLNGDHLRHKLKFTNMGRTPAHVLRYYIGYSREVNITDKQLIDASKRPETVFERLLSGNDSLEVEEVDVAEYIRDSIKAIGDSAAIGILSGWVEYQHVFSDVEVVNVPFAYLYQPLTQRLERIPIRKAEKKK